MWKFFFHTFLTLFFFLNLEAHDRWVTEKMALGAIVDHPVSTSNLKAQQYFNQGLAYIFAFNHDFAFLEFEKAAQEDPNLAMAYWGMALALGQNINQEITPINEKKTYAYSRRALSLMSHASLVEQAYIQALAVRYTNDPNRDLIALRHCYYNAMKRLVECYPEDLDATCLYAESILDLDPWRYWTWDGLPKKGTMDAIHILQSVLSRDPYHTGANHFYVHVWEASPTPERALLSAFRLTTLFPEGGHLLHMPCHIFLLCGYYEEAIDTSKRAIAMDRRYVQEHGMDGAYPLHYLTHNLRILVRAYMLSEDYENAVQVMEELSQFVTPYHKETSLAHLAKNLIVPTEVNLYFQRWKELLKLSHPDTNDPFVQAYWHFGRAMAYIHLGNKASYQKERCEMVEFQKKIPPDDEAMSNPSVCLIALGALLLDAEEVKATPSVYISKLMQAVEIQDRLDYAEPPPWYQPLRIELGQALLEQKCYPEAETVFKKGLQEYQRNGRLLKGLYQSLQGQQRDWDAFWVEREASGPGGSRNE